MGKLLKGSLFPTLIIDRGGRSVGANLLGKTILPQELHSSLVDGAVDCGK